MKLAMKQAMLCMLFQLVLTRSFSPSAKASIVRQVGADSQRGGALKSAVATSGGATAAQAAGDDSGLVTSGTINLVKCIVGAGVLALPAGIGAFADAPAALIPASVGVAILGSASAYSFSVLGRVCKTVGASSYKEAWEKTIGPKSAPIVEFFCTLTPLLACLSYSMILGDAFSSLLSTAGVPAATFAAFGPGGARTFCISSLSVLALWPLCSLKSLKALAPTSALGTAGVVYTMLFMIKRALDGTYGAGGKFTAALKLAGAAVPKFGAKAIARPAKAGVFIGMLGTAFMAHFNAPSFFEEAANSMKTFNKVVVKGFGLSVIINVAVLAAGFMTFGTAANGLILNNYASTDVLATLARALFGASIVFTFPLAFAGAKGGIRQLIKTLIGKVVKNDEAREPLVVAAPLALITALAITLSDVGVIVSLTGALMGSAIIYILPAIMLAKCDTMERSSVEKKAVPAAMIALGLVSAYLGVTNV